MRKAAGGGTAAARNTAAAAKPAVGPVVRQTPAPLSRRTQLTRIGPKPAEAPGKLAIVQPRKAPQPSAPPPAPVPVQPATPFLSLLLARRQELTGNLKETKFDTLAKMGRVAEDDQAQMSHEEFISLQRNSMDYQALRQVNVAIERVQSGDYGICASCEEPISDKRLKAIPWAKYCVTCQDRVQTNGLVDEDTPSEGDVGF
jgi:DnaK suppressor protein